MAESLMKVCGINQKLHHSESVTLKNPILLHCSPPEYDSEWNMVASFQSGVYSTITIRWAVQNKPALKSQQNIRVKRKSYGILKDWWKYVECCIVPHQYIVVNETWWQHFNPASVRESTRWVVQHKPTPKHRKI